MPIGVGRTQTSFLHSSPNTIELKESSTNFISDLNHINSNLNIKSTNTSSVTAIGDEICERMTTTHKDIRTSFSIDNLLATPRVPRGRRPNAKYPRVQACKSMSPFMFPLFPITQPAGITIRDEDMSTKIE